MDKIFLIFSSLGISHWALGIGHYALGAIKSWLPGLRWYKFIKQNIAMFNKY